MEDTSRHLASIAINYTNTTYGTSLGATYWKEMFTPCRFCWFFMFFTTFSRCSLLKFSVDVATNPWVPRAKDLSLDMVQAENTDSSGSSSSDRQHRGTERAFSAATADAECLLLVICPRSCSCARKRCFWHVGVVARPRTGRRAPLLACGTQGLEATSTENFSKLHQEKVVKNMKNQQNRHSALVDSCYFECSKVLKNIQNRELVYLKLCRSVWINMLKFILETSPVSIRYQYVPSDIT